MKKVKQVRINSELHRLLKVESAKTGQTIQSIINNSWIEFAKGPIKLMPHITKISRKEYLRIKNKKFRDEILIHYGGNPPKCNCCGDNHYEFLSMDHVKGGGNNHRKRIKSSIYKWLKINNFPEGFQVLCHNCNFAKSHYVNGCPHGRLGEKL